MAISSLSNCSRALLQLLRPLLRRVSTPSADTLADGAALIDARPLNRFAKAHSLGAVSISLRSVFASWLGWLAPPPPDCHPRPAPRRNRLVGGQDRIRQPDRRTRRRPRAWTAAQHDMATTPGPPIRIRTSDSLTRPLRRHPAWFDGTDAKWSPVSRVNQGDRALRVAATAMPSRTKQSPRAGRAGFSAGPRCRAANRLAMSS